MAVRPVSIRDYEIARQKMVKEQLAGRGITDQRVLDAMREVPRHVFLDPALGPQAYSEHAFPIGYSQTISQPYMVAYLAEQLALEGTEKVLEIGTGSGYQAAVLSRLAGFVFTVERIAELASRATAALRRINVGNVRVRAADGAAGWKDVAPFERILLTAAATEVPKSLLMQLSDGGFLLGPVVNKSGQEIVKVVRNGSQFHLDRLKKCQFVPLVRGTAEGPGLSEDRLV